MKIVIGMATIKGREHTLKITMQSLNNQTVKPDIINVYNNDDPKNVNLTDNAKFYFLTMFDEPVYYFTCDDDIIYPPDYVENTIKAIEEHKCIVSYHGRILRGKGLSYYHGHTRLGCNHNHPRDVELCIVGTGVTAFRTDYFNPAGLHEAEDKRMSDLVFSLEATKQGKKMMHIGHKGNWIVIQQLPKGSTIYDTEHNNCDRQSEVADEIWSLKNK